MRLMTAQHAEEIMETVEEQNAAVQQCYVVG
jgi:hypothetical protein